MISPESAVGLLQKV